MHRHHQHADHQSGFRWHRHDNLEYHVHHRRPDYVSYRTPNGWTALTGTPVELAEATQ